MAAGSDDMRWFFISNDLRSLLKEVEALLTGANTAPIGWRRFSKR